MRRAAAAAGSLLARRPAPVHKWLRVAVSSEGTSVKPSLRIEDSEVQGNRQRVCGFGPTR